MLSYDFRDHLVIENLKFNSMRRVGYLVTVAEDGTAFTIEKSKPGRKRPVGRRKRRWVCIVWVFQGWRSTEGYRWSRKM